MFAPETVTSVSYRRFLFQCESGGRRPLYQYNHWYLANLLPQDLHFPVAMDNKDKKETLFRKLISVSKQRHHGENRRKQNGSIKAQ